MVFGKKPANIHEKIRRENNGKVGGTRSFIRCQNESFRVSRLETDTVGESCF